MAAPSYTEDLTDITLAEDVTNWIALGGGASGLGAGADFAMEGTNCVDKQITNAEKGQVYNNGSTITPGTNTHFFIWTFLATPGVANTLANRGLAMILGTATTAYNAFHVEGSDTYGATGRVGKCYPIRYVTTANGSIPYRTLTGSPGANPQYFGATANITAAVKSANLGVDAIRYGTGIYIIAGDAVTPATFTGAASANDAISARWGILSWIAGSNYELQGRFVVGQNNAYTPTPAYFSDSNKNILLLDTVHSLTDFTQLIVDHASTELYLTNVTIEAAGTNNPGQLVFNNSSTVSTLTRCTFVKMGVFTLNAGITATNCTWRQCGQITQQGATLTNCTVSNGGKILSSSPANAALITGTTFTSSGTGHGVEIGGAAANITLTNLTWNNYAASDGSTGNEAIYVNISAGSMNITISGGTTPTIRTAGCAVTVISGAVNVTVIAKTVSGASIQGVRVLLTASAGPLPFDIVVTITRVTTTATVAHTAHGMATNDKVQIKGANEIDYNGVYTITKINNDSYSYTVSNNPATPATGEIKATFVALAGLTDVNGQITMSRVFLSNQPVTGRVRKSTASPLYKTGSLIGNTINSSSGLSITAVMIFDE